MLKYRYSPFVLLDRRPQRAASKLIMPAVTRRRAAGTRKTVRREYVKREPVKQESTDHTVIKPAGPRFETAEHPAIRRRCLKREFVKKKPRVKREQTSQPERELSHVQEPNATPEAAEMSTFTFLLRQKDHSFASLVSTGVRSAQNQYPYLKVLGIVARRFHSGIDWDAKELDYVPIRMRPSDEVAAAARAENWDEFKII